MKALFAIEDLGDGHFRADHVEGPGDVVFGGQMLAQTIVAASRAIPDKRVKSMHTIFARGGSRDAPLEIDVEPMHVGRAFASATVTLRQGDRLCSRSLVLLDVDEPDLIRFGAPMPSVAPPGAPTNPEPWWDVAVVGDVDISDPEAVGPPELDVWTRFPDAPGDSTSSQALLAYASDGFLIGTAMRPHPGVGQALAHVSISTTVLSHTLTFHDEFDASEWLLLAHESPQAGRGRSYGRAHVYTADGRLVASYVQENMIRDFPKGQAPAAGERARH
ncbi:MAG: acyl-CoA thioesterase [Acidimicrobiales bacterium]